jgi:hypothetical protein
VIRKIFELAKQQRLAWSCAAIVGLFLVLVGHVPLFAVMAGCALAISISMLRSASKSHPRPVRLRGGR